MKLIIQNIKFYSILDELSFDFYLKNMNCGVERVGSQIVLTIDKEVDEVFLRNVFGLVERYSVEITNLKEVLNDNNSEFLLNKNKYWSKYFLS